MKIEQEIKEKLKAKIDYMEEYIKTVEITRNDLEREVKGLKNQNKMLSKNNAVQQWRDMYNIKDKECFNALLKLAKKEKELEEIKKYLGISSKTIMQRLEELQERRDELSEENEKLKEQLKKIRREVQEDVTCESRECGCDDYGECLECLKDTILNIIN